MIAGDLIHIHGEYIMVKHDISFGHKIALTHILNDEQVIKYGLPIGRATVDILPGEHVHTQNLKSDYHP